jgi:hypothetical protein
MDESDQRKTGHQAGQETGGADDGTGEDLTGRHGAELVDGVDHPPVEEAAHDAPGQVGDQGPEGDPDQGGGAVTAVMAHVVPDGQATDHTADDEEEPEDLDEEDVAHPVGKNVLARGRFGADQAASLEEAGAAEEALEDMPVP